MTLGCTVLNKMDSRQHHDESLGCSAHSRWPPWNALISEADLFHILNCNKLHSSLNRQSFSSLVLPDNSIIGGVYGHTFGGVLDSTPVQFITQIPKVTSLNFLFPLAAHPHKYVSSGCCSAAHFHWWRRRNNSPVLPHTNAGTRF